MPIAGTFKPPRLRFSMIFSSLSQSCSLLIYQKMPIPDLDAPGAVLPDQRISITISVTALL